MVTDVVFAMKKADHIIGLVRLVNHVPDGYFSRFREVGAETSPYFLPGPSGNNG